MMTHVTVGDMRKRVFVLLDVLFALTGMLAVNYFILEDESIPAPLGIFLAFGVPCLIGVLIAETDRGKFAISYPVSALLYGLLAAIVGFQISTAFLAFLTTSLITVITSLLLISLFSRMDRDVHFRKVLRTNNC